MSSIIKSKIKVLIVFANPHNTDSLRLGAEDRVIHEAIMLSPHRERISITVRHAATVHDLRRALLADEFQIVHISGHGSEEGLVLEDEIGSKQVIPQAALADLFQAYSPPIQCVILNACYSIYQRQLTTLGVPFTIAMERSISDKAAIEFSRGFYDAIGAGRTIDFAYEEGCRTVNLVVPNPNFVSQLLIRDSPKHSLLEDIHKLPRGFISIKYGNKYIAVNPASFQSGKELAGELYLDYLASQYQPNSYGSSWVIVSSTEPVQRILAPWSWLFHENYNEAVTEFDKDWINLPVTELKLMDQTHWQIESPPLGPLMGLAANNKELVERIFKHSRKWIEIIKALRSKEHGLELIPPERLSPEDYKFLFVLTSGWFPHSFHGMAIIVEHIDLEALGAR